jgi:hypothetical protein
MRNDAASSGLPIQWRGIAPCTKKISGDKKAPHRFKIITGGEGQ